MAGQSADRTKIGQEYGDIRAPLPLDRLVPYLEKHVEGYAGPLEVKQFKVGLGWGHLNVRLRPVLMNSLAKSVSSLPVARQKGRGWEGDTIGFSGAPL